MSSQERRSLLQVCEDIAKLLPTTQLKDTIHIVEAYRENDWQKHIKISKNRQRNTYTVMNILRYL